MDHVDIFHVCVEMCKAECTEMQLKFQNSENPSVFVAAPTPGGTGLSVPVEHHV